MGGTLLQTFSSGGFHASTHWRGYEDRQAKNAIFDFTKRRFKWIWQQLIYIA